MPSRKVAVAVEEFASRVVGLRPGNLVRVPIAAARERNSDVYGGWGAAPGIYFFEQGPVLQYVGRALRRTGLRARVHKNCTSFGDPMWDCVIKDDATIVGVVPLEDADWYWAASLEAYLISTLKPSFNRRDS